MKANAPLLRARRQDQRPTILSFFGTRPEIIKMAPVIHAFSADTRIRQLVCDTGQHREMAKPLIRWFHLRPDVRMNLMAHNQSLSSFAARALVAIDRLLEKTSPDMVVCQGDTTTAMVVALAAFHRKVRVAHVEAGLRSGNKHAPWPEEVNRRVIDLVSDAYFAPTRGAREHLLHEGVHPSAVSITGNTAIDALHWTLHRIRCTSPSLVPLPSRVRRLLRTRPGKGRLPLAIVTVHRREVFGAAMLGLADCLEKLARQHPHLLWLFPVHLNPNVHSVMFARLAQQPNIVLTKPIDYPLLCMLLARTTFVLTDSGGLQEECPSLGTPVFVMRDVTERPEGICTGNIRLVGTRGPVIFRKVNAALAVKQTMQRMSRKRHPYGDGRAGPRIAKHLVHLLLRSRIP